jgi:mgtE-like transporter
MATPSVHASAWAPVAARAAGLARAQATNFRQGLAALMVATAANLMAGLTLGLMSETLERLPSLFILVPAAIAMRGNVFGALGSRLGTAVHTGQWDGRAGPPSRRSYLGQNLEASAILTLFVSAAVALLAREASRLVGLPAISFLEFLTVSVVGGLLASAVVLVITLVMAVISVRQGWDMDNVAAPVVTAAGDLITIPSLWLATFLLVGPVPEIVGLATLAALGVAALPLVGRRDLETMRDIVRQSAPILLLAGLVDVIAGLTIEGRAEEFFVLPALLVLLPPLLADAGALGGILSARLSSRLHLGSLEPRAVPGKEGLEDILLSYLLAVPIFLVVGLGAGLVSSAAGLAGLGLGTMVALSLLAGLMATTGAVFVAYYSAVLSFRLGLDPDNYGIPTITAAMDLLGVLALVASLVILGVAA